ncbi:60 kDa SS-A Ro ribonucleo -like [Paramuricea clavata]|uniref:60 kDa SS-A Ro ribonucleo -like n=2 Tax=Paramuricea clavata TaxID=317549 RepID=A0A7D9DVK1_PARCT|nr:60 kDa SS-A Ro ribonucleo -like [Paramuricea clavata]
MAQNHQTPNHQTPNQQPEPMEQSDNISQSEKIRKDQVENSAKGMVWLVDDINRLRRFLVLGSEIPTYYIGQRELGIENAKAIVRLFEAGRGVEVVSEILTFSLEGRTAKQNSIMLALAMCARLGDLPTKRKAYEVMPQICRIPTHLFMFVDLSKKLSKPTTGWGRAPRKAIQKWYIEKAPMKLAMALTKYQKREGWSHADVARVTHLKSDNPAIQCVLKYAVRGFAEMSTAFPDSVQNSEELNSVLNFFKAVEEMKKLTKDDADRVVELIEGQQLVREHIPTVCLGSKKVWDALLKKMPMTAMIRNLNKMTAIGLLEENNEQVQLVCENLRNEDLLKKARIHPFNVLLALKQYESGRGDKGSLTWKAIPIITKALEDAFYLSFKNVEPTGKRHMLAMDVSGSMQCGGCVGSPSIQPHVASAAMAMVTARTEDDHIFVAFSHTIVPMNINSHMRLEEVLKAASSVSDKVQINTSKVFAVLRFLFEISRIYRPVYTCNFSCYF